MPEERSQSSQSKLNLSPVNAHVFSIHEIDDFSLPELPFHRKNPSLCAVQSHRTSVLHPQGLYHRKAFPAPG